jgi:hypothetical protein
MAKPKNMTDMCDQMLNVIEDMKTGGIRVADAKERFNGYGKIIAGNKAMLENMKVMKVNTGVEFLKDE